jgi:hypothetical protein
MTVAGSDAGFSLHGACVHSLRFSFAAPLDYPYSPAEMAPDSPALFRRLQAASPPPARKGNPWQTGMTLDGEPFDPAASRDRLADVKHPEGADNLDTPDPDTVILDWMFDIPRERHTVTMPGDDDGKFLLSIPYWNPAEETGHDVTQTVEYHATHRIEWGKAPTDDWIAVSFDNFWPKERDSADLLIPLGDCDDLCPTGA